MNESLIKLIVEILLIVVILLGIVWKAFVGKKNNHKVDLEKIPGHSEECGRRGEEITRLVTNYDFVVKSIDEINKSLANLWKYVRTNGTGG